MNPIRRLVHGLRSWIHSDDTDRDLAEEVEHFYAEAIADLVERGVPAAEARRRVRQIYGDELGARENVRASLWESGVQDLFVDVRMGVRRLRRSPGFTAVVASVLGLGIGAATTIVSVVRPVLFDDLRYPAAERLVALEDRADTGEPYPVTFGTYVELRSRTNLVEEVAVHRSWQPTLTGRGEPQRLEGQRVSAHFFDLLGVMPRIGRGLDPAEDHADGANDVVLGHRLWVDRFDADPEVIGRTIELDGVVHEVVGVMPEGFRSVVRPEADLWALLQYGPATSFDGPEWGHHLGMIGRLRPGAETTAARAEVAGIAANPIEEFPRPGWAALENGMVMTPLRSHVTAAGRGTGLVLISAAGLLLLIACVNLAILLVSRGLRRRNEMAVRTALGAGRGRLVRQLTTESVLLAGLGGVLGIGVAAISMGAVVAALPTSLRGLGVAGIDIGTVSFAMLVTLLVGIAGGVIPALVASRRVAVTGGARGSAPAHRISHRLVVAEVAIAVVLLIGAGLLTRTMQNLLAEPYGVEPGSTFVMQVWATSVPGGDDSIHRFWDRSLDEILDLPGVRSAAVTTQLPLSGGTDMYGVVVDGTGRVDGADGSVLRYSVSPGYHELLGIPIREGRALAITDRGDAPSVAVVSASLARSLFGDESAVGQRVRVGAGRGAFTIVGVAGDVRQESLASDFTAAVYTTPHQWHWADRVRWIAVDLADDAVVADVKRAVWSVDPDLSIVSVERFADLVRRSEARRRFVLTVVGIFAAFALLLSGIGLYGVLASQVTDRRREMGIRAALGASRPEIVGLVVRQGLRMSTVGLAIGVVAAMLLSKGLASLLFGVSGLDPVTYLGVAALFLLVAGIASWVPARRAARADPLRSLVAE